MTVTWFVNEFFKSSLQNCSCVCLLHSSFDLHKSSQKVNLPINYHLVHVVDLFGCIVDEPWPTQLTASGLLILEYLIKQYNQQWMTFAGIRRLTLKPVDSRVTLQTYPFLVT